MTTRFADCGLPPPAGRLRRLWVLAAATILLGCSGGGGGGSTTEQVREETEPPPPPPVVHHWVAAWGDSLTSGAGSASAGNSYPEQLQRLLGRDVFNGGVSGQTSDQIAARQGGAPARLTLDRDQIPASGSAEVIDQSTFPITAQGPGPIPGSLAGVAGSLSLDDGRLRFTRSESGQAVPVAPQTPFHPDDFGRRHAIAVFWYGTNNFWEAERVKADIAASVNHLTTDRYLVLGLMNAPYEPRGSDSYRLKLALNEELAATYGERFIDIRRILIERYDPTQPGDVEDHANDVPPRSLRHDEEHPNDAGYAIVAEVVADRIRQMGW